MMKSQWRRFALIAVGVAVLGATTAPAAVRYVDAAAGGGANNGTSWTDGYTSLVAALAAAGSGDDLWVAEGTYNEGATIAMKSGVNMYGGFTSGMVNLGDRDWDANATFLTGAGVRQVITGHAAILDGFIITNGAAATGAGMAIAGQVTTVRNCTFANNVATGNGGAVYNTVETGDATFSNCTFRFNTALNGGALAINAADPSILDSTFFRNSATASGGAIHNENSAITLQIYGSTFTSNSAVTQGGAINQGVVTLDISNCVFAANSSPLGAVFRINGASPGLVVDSKFLGNISSSSAGALSLRTSPTTVFRRCVFAGNSATGAGGAVGGDRSDAQTYEDCIFSGNRSGSTGGAFGGASANASTHRIKRSLFAGNESATLGGAIYGNHSAASTPTPLMENCVLAGNVAGTSGGGLYSAVGESRVIHSTLANNRANSTSGGAIYAAGSQVVYVTNTISWANSAGTSGNEIFENPVNRANVNYSAVQGGWLGALGGNNIDTDPLFAGGPSGNWEATGAYDPVNAQTALQDTGAAWAINAHAGKTVNPDTTQYLQFVIASNSVNTLYVWGNARNNRLGGAVADVTDNYQIHSYAITSGSTSKDTGLNVGVTDDILSVVRPKSAGYDRGAYEFDVVTPSAYTITGSATMSAGASQSLTITALDAGGATLTTFSQDQSLTFSGLGNAPGGQIPTVTDKTAAAVNQGTAVLLTFANGVCTAGGSLVAYDAEGPVTLHATDGTASSAAGTGAAGLSLTVNPGVADHLTITSSTADLMSGATRAITAEIQDAYDNLLTSDSATSVTFAQTAGAGSVTGTGAATASAGIASKTVTGGTAGSVTLTATASGMSDDTTTFTVTAATVPPSAYTITGSASMTAGGSQSLTITALDAGGATLTTFSQDQSLTFSGLGNAPGGQIPTVTDKTGTPVNQGTPVLLTFANGVCTAGGSLVAYDAEGPVTLHATDGIASSAAGTGAAGLSLTVSPASASTLTVSGFASPATAGVAADVTVTAKDLYDNTATGYAGTIAFTVGVADAGKTLPANFTFVPATDNGIKTFGGGVTLTLAVAAGGQSLTATDTVTGSITGTQSGITVDPGAADHLTITSSTGDLLSGATRNITAEIRDAFENVRTSDSATSVTFAQTAGAGSVTGAGAATAAAGIATKTVTGGDAGSVTLSASASGMTDGTTTFTVTVSVKYVNGALGPVGDGASWATAYNNLDTALGAAASGDQVWVAQGTYVPATAFTMKSGVAVYGGFASGDATLSARNWVTRPTILSGDALGDDSANFGMRTDNRARVVTFSSVTGARLDGFQVRGAYSIDNADNGGIYVAASTLVVANCWINDNRVYRGGGVAVGFSTTGNYGTFINTIISTNFVSRDGGGLSFLGASGEMSLLHCTVQGNTFDDTGIGRHVGGVMLSVSGTTILSMTNTIVWGNAKGATRRNLYYNGVPTVRTDYSTYTVDNGTPHTPGAADQVGVDPLLIDPANLDYHLSPSSPCKTAGLAPLLTPVLQDYELVTRSVTTPSFGAYEFVADLTPPGEVSGESVTPGHALLTLGWTNPGDGDFAGILAIRKLGSAPTGSPTPGATYTVGNAIGDGTVAYVGAGTGFVDTPLVNGSTYYYTLCTYDTVKNYSTGVGVSGTPVADNTAPDAVTSLSVAAQSETTIQLDWVNSVSADAVGVLIVRRTGGLPTGTPADTTTYTVGNAIGDGTVVYVGTGSSGTPGAASTWTDTTSIQEQTLYGYSVFALDSVPNYATRADGSDTTPADTTAPGNVTAPSATGGDVEVELAWTHPADADVAGVLILRSTVATPDGTPVDGVTYTAGNVLGNGSVVHVSSGATPSGAGNWTDTGLVNGTLYYYRIFARDGHPNYAAGGVAVSATPNVSILFVDGSLVPAGDGASWATAYNNLDTALGAAVSDDQVWVAQGTYVPATAFTMKSGVAVYGGFASGDATLSARNWVTRPTILSGDTNNDDTPNFGNRLDNKARVVTFSSVTGATLDGFTVRGGYSGTGVNADNGGIHIAGSTLTVANCWITDNRVYRGGGVAVGFGSTGNYGTFVNTIISTNFVAFDGGGLSFLGASGEMSLLHCTVQGNTFDNTSARHAGGVMLSGTGTTILSMTNTIVWGNAKGATRRNLYYNSSPTARTAYSYYTVDNGTPHTPGAGDQVNVDPLLNDPANLDYQLAPLSPCKTAGLAPLLTPVLQDYALAPRSLTTPSIGALEYIPTPPAEVSGVSFTADYNSLDLSWVNPVADFAGVLVIRRQGSAPTGTPEIGVTYAVGNAIGDGTVAYVGAGNSFTDVGLADGTTYHYKFCTYDAEKNYSAGVGASDATLLDSTAPGNVTAASATGGNANVALAWTHPADADVAGVVILRSTVATPDGVPVVGVTYTAGNVLGNGTVVHVSSGATPSGAGNWTDTGLVNGTLYYYRIFARDGHPNYASGGVAVQALADIATLFVDVAAGAGGDGASWATAYDSLVDALAVASSGDELWVAAGTYKPAGAGGPASSRFNLASGVKLYGGFAGTESALSERDWVVNSTVLSGDLDGNDTASWGNRGDNVVNVLYASGVTGVILDGFMVQGGYSAAGYGGGLYASASVIAVTNCTFMDNRALRGGGMYLLNTPATVDACRFVSNSANGSPAYGGGLYASSASAMAGTVRNSVFSGNRSEGSASSDGGGLFLIENSYSIVNCTIYGNYAQRRGGGLKLGSQFVTPVNYALKNCIVLNNTAGSGANFFLQNDGTVLTVDMTYCNWGGVGTYANASATFNSSDLQVADPLFENAAGGDFHLTASSPCKDAGTSSGAPATDLDGVARPYGAGYDIGAYEFVPPLTVTINQAGGQGDPSSDSPILFTVVFSEAVTDFATGDVTLAGTAGATTAMVTGSGTTYTVEVSGMTSTGTVIATIAAGRAHAAAGNGNQASTSTDNTVTRNEATTVMQFK